jgi:hypothetical protein
MAEIPSRLTLQLTDKTPNEIYETLRRERCLSTAGLEKRAEALEVIKGGAAESQRNAERRLIGATREYIVILRLGGGGYLNGRARKLLNALAVCKPKRWW